MKDSVIKQFLALGVLAIFLGALNNLRPSAHIDWIRHWAPYSALESAEPAIAPESEPTGEAAPVALSADEVATIVAENVGINDIGLDTAKALFDHARDFTLWIDARDPELYAEGHIEGAELLHFYEQNSYLGDIQEKIAELQPIALVLYCKGKDCTDSHHLAEDLSALGHANIFVYRDGFQDWYQAGYPITGNLAEADEATDAAPAAEPIDEGQAMAEVAALIDGNVGITDIDIATAKKIYQHGRDFTFWIDARDDELFAKGHIAGAHQVYYYEQNSYLPAVQPLIDEMGPMALVLYCKGPDCMDSHHLAEDMAAMGHANIFVYKGGFDAWYEAGYPIEGELAETEQVMIGAVPTPRALPEEKPPGMYLEHVVRDMFPFAFGLLLLIFWKRTIASKPLMLSAVLFVGGFFIYAAMPKMGTPLQFATSIWNYAIVPGVLVNPSALILPALEILCGLGLVRPAPLSLARESPRSG